MEARMNFLAHAFVLLQVEMEMGNFITSFSLIFLIKKLCNMKSSYRIFFIFEKKLENFDNFM